MIPSVAVRPSKPCTLHWIVSRKTINLKERARFQTDLHAALLFFSLIINNEAVGRARHFFSFGYLIWPVGCRKAPFDSFYLRCFVLYGLHGRAF